MRAILFDLDGTLLDSAHTFTLLLNQLRAKLSLPPLQETELRLATANGTNALLIQALNIPPTDERFNAYKQEFLQSYTQFLMHSATPFFPGIVDLLEYLNQHTIPWGIVTNKHQQFTQQIIATQPLLATAGTLISGDTLPVGKPNPEPVRYACAQLAILPQDALFIGDHPHDILAGKRAGTQTGLALYGYFPPPLDPHTLTADYYFASGQAILEYLSLHCKI